MRLDLALVLRFYLILGITAQRRTTSTVSTAELVSSNVESVAAPSRGVISSQSALTTAESETSDMASAVVSSTIRSTSPSSVSSSSSITSSTSVLAESTSLLTSFSSSSSATTTSEIATSTTTSISYETTYFLPETTASPTTTSRTLVIINTTSASSEATAALNAASQENSTGLSSQNKKIIIGVIAGIAGLVILSAFATLLYRILGKKSSEDDYAEQKDLSFTSSAHESNHATAFSNDDYSPTKSRTRIGEISQNF